MRARSHAKAGALSLVEVVMAMGIVAIGLAAAISLLSVSLNSNKTSKEDTLIVAMSANVIADLKKTPFGSLSSPAPPSYAFDSEGAVVATASSTALYECAVTLTADADQNAFGVEEFHSAKSRFRD